MGFLTLVPGNPHIGSESQVPGEGSKGEGPRSRVLSIAYGSRVPGPGAHFSGMPNKVVLKHFAIFIGKHLCWDISLIKFIVVKFIVFSCEYCKIFRDIFFVEYLWTALWTFSYRNKIHNSNKPHRKWIRRFLNDKIKNDTKTQLDEKNLPFHVLHNFVFLYFSTARHAAFALRNKGDSSEVDFRTA